MNNKHSIKGVVKAALIIQLTGLLVLGVFRSQALLSYTYDLPPNQVSEQVIASAEIWNHQMEEIGAVWFSEQVTGTVDMLHGEEEY